MNKFYQLLMSAKVLWGVAVFLCGLSSIALSDPGRDDMGRYVDLKRKIHQLNLIKVDEGEFVGRDNALALSHIIQKLSEERDRLEKKLGIKEEVPSDADTPGSLEDKWEFDSQHEL